MSGRGPNERDIARAKELAAEIPRRGKTPTEIVAEVLAEAKAATRDRPLGHDAHTVRMTIAPREDRAARAYALSVQLRPLDWHVTWERWSPGSVAWLRCEGPTNDEALSTIKAWAESMPLLEDA